MSEKNEYKWMVRVSCMTFNHAAFIVDAMNGFTMQQTDFPYVCTIIDDASTDGEQEVIKNYLNEHFDLDDKNIARQEETDDYVLTFVRHKTNINCYFVVLFLKYNHYSIKKPKLPYLSEWLDNSKYHALCEGDDYWTDCKYLKKKIDILEGDDGISMVCNRTICFSQRKQQIVGYKLDFCSDRYLEPETLILKGGGYIATCSMVYRRSVRNDYPDYCITCHVGDYPLQIMSGMKGKVYYLSDTMTVYRVDNPNSWVGKNWGKLSLDKLQSEICLLSGFSHDYPSFHKTFQLRKRRFILQHVPNRKEERSLYKEYKIRFDDIIGSFSFKERVLFYINSSSKKDLIHKILKMLMG